VTVPPSETDALLAECAREPIHLLGGVQPHGVLLAWSPQTGRLVQVSANAEALLGVPVEALLGQPLEALLPEALAPRPIPSAPFQLSFRGRAFDALEHQSDGLGVLELEPALAEGEAQRVALASLGGMLAPLGEARGPEALLRTAADGVRALTGFDRVMVYRFDPDWNGEVVAESRAKGVDSFLGLHFPASDIPAQARALYVRNRLRLIADARARPVPLVPPGPPGLARPLDLSGAALRSVSPVHLEYLGNMGVRASFSISLLREGRLWGLIACHHHAPRWLPPGLRVACDVLGQLLSLQLVSEERGALAEERASRLAQVAALVERLDSLASLEAHAPELLALVGAQGAALLLDGPPVGVGRVPPPGALAQVADWLASGPLAPASSTSASAASRAGGGGPPGDVFTTDQLGALLPALAPHAEVASGLLVLRLETQPPRSLLFFRTETARTVTWAGNPEKAVVPAVVPEGVQEGVQEGARPGEVRLHPRRSFAAWVAQVRGRSRPWTATDLEAARELRGALVGVVLKQAEALERLSRQLDASNTELDAFSTTVSHDLKEPLRGIQSYASFLREDHAERLEGEGLKQLAQVEWLAAHAQARLSALLDYSRLGRVDLAVGEVDLQEVLEETLASVGARLAENRVEVRVPRPLPRVRCDQARIHAVWENLLANAAKYRREEPPRWVEVTYAAPGEPRPPGALPGEEGHVFCVADNGIGIAERHHAAVFEMFRRLHPAQAYGGGSGAGLAIVKRIVERHGGRMWLLSAPGQGSRFLFTLGTGG
jgi:light-regulated signal transduction histidine kinase (bacteriophytochrome)